MTAPGIAEALDIVEQVGSCLVPRTIDPAGRALGLERREEESMAALSQTLPDRLIEQVMP